LYPNVTQIFIILNLDIVNARSQGPYCPVGGVTGLMPLIDDELAIYPCSNPIITPGIKYVIAWIEA